jgi:hypothetical protein
MILFTIHETTMLTMHLLLFPVLLSRAAFFRSNPAAGCDITYAVLRLPIEAVSPQLPYPSE